MENLKSSHTYNEIISQSEVWKTTINQISSQRETILKWLKKAQNQVIFTGCGSTYYLSLHAAAVWQQLTNTFCRGLPSSEIWLFPTTGIKNTQSLLIATSRSGYTTETLKAISVFTKLYGDNSIAITCYKDQDISKLATHTIVAEDASEQSIAQTRAFTSMVIIADYLAGLISNNDGFINDLTLLPNIVERLIYGYNNDLEVLGHNLDFDHFIFLGSGSNYGIACEAMIKMKEMTLSNSEAYHFLEFRHGPKSIVNSKTAIVGILSDTAKKEENAVLEDMKKLGAYVIAVDESGENIHTDKVFCLNSTVGEIFHGILALPLLQLLAYYRAIAKNLDPDRPANLSSVVTLDCRKD